MSNESFNPDNGHYVWRLLEQNTNDIRSLTQNITSLVSEVKHLASTCENTYKHLSEKVKSLDESKEEHATFINLLNTETGSLSKDLSFIKKSLDSLEQKVKEIEDDAKKQDKEKLNRFNQLIFGVITGALATVVATWFLTSGS